jgi:hypothetical protein
VFRVALANDSHHAVPLDHFAVLADRFDAATNFHDISPKGFWPSF